MQFHQFVVYQQMVDTIPSTTHKEINEETVDLFEGWEQYQMEKICPHIKEWKASNLGLGRNFCASILKGISEVELPHLSEIHLYQNDIESIERLNKIWMPELRCLYLSGNKIAHIDSLKKCNFPNLFLVDLSDNKIVSLDSISFSVAVNQIALDFEDENEQGCDLRMFAKVPIKIDSSELWTTSEKRIRQKKTMNTLRKKFSFLPRLRE